MATQRGIQDSLIKTLCRWESSTYTVYIQRSLTFAQYLRGWPTPARGRRTVAGTPNGLPWAWFCCLVNNLPLIRLG